MVLDRTGICAFAAYALHVLVSPGIPRTPVSYCSQKGKGRHGPQPQEFHLQKLLTSAAKCRGHHVQFLADGHFAMKRRLVLEQYQQEGMGGAHDVGNQLGSKGLGHG
jgi:hypothetical protein